MPVARVRPSGANATACTALVWPVSGRPSWSGRVGSGLVRIVRNGATAPAIPPALAATPPRLHPSATDGDEGGRR